MNDDLANTLLYEIMGWTPAELTEERLNLQRLSEYKYDEYRQFFPGGRFIESLGLWLKNFPTKNERKTAYDFIKKNLVFVSSSELDHLIRMGFPDVIRPYLVKQVASMNTSFNENHINKILKSTDYKLLKRQCLFLGLSDGARIDIFRRHSGLDHEQVFPTYQITEEKSKEFVDKLRKNLASFNSNSKQNEFFKIIFLLDDFSASGISFIRKEKGNFEGKINKFYNSLKKTNQLSQLIDDNLKICILLYMCTSKSKDHIQSFGNELFQKDNIEFSVKTVHEINDSVKIDKTASPDFYEIIKKYYDNKIESNPSYQKGKMNNGYLGFDECGLTIVINHNCPNNSLPILWYDPHRYDYRGLFPRVERFPSD